MCSMILACQWVVWPKRFSTHCPLSLNSHHITGILQVWEVRYWGRCFVQLQFGKRVFRERVVVIKNLRHRYILWQVLHRSYQFGTRYSTTGKHYITINGQIIAQAILQSIDYPLFITKGKVTLPPMSVSIIEVKTLKIPNTTNLCEVNAQLLTHNKNINTYSTNSNIYDNCNY